MQPLTLIIPFEVPEGQEEAFRQQWHQTTAEFRQANGFLSARLYEVSTDIEQHLRQHFPEFCWLDQRAHARFRFVSLTEWASVAAYQQATHSSRVEDAISFPAYPAWYRLDFPYIQPEIQSEMQPFTLIVPFDVPVEQETVFRQQWNDIITSMGKADGAFGPGLYELDTDTETQLRSSFSSRFQEAIPYRFINVAGWASLAHYEEVLRSPQRASKPISLPSYPAYYRVVAEFIG